MERKFCPNCGKLFDDCECEDKSTNFGTTGFGGKKAEEEKSSRSGKYYVKRFDKIALSQDEQVVRQYHIGEFARVLGSTGKGSMSILVSNKRVISKSDSNYFGTSSISVEEIALDSIAGVKNYYSQGFTIWRIVVAILSIIFGFIAMSITRNSSTGVIFGLILFAIGAWMAYKSRKPSYLFSIYATTTSQAMEMGANLRGKLFNSSGNGIVFQYKPTREAVTMMCELGACITDLKTKGDYAIDAWKNTK